MATVTNTLTWNKNAETTVVGYNVYRNIGSAPTKIASEKVNTTVIPTLTYIDVVSADGDYFYAVTAVDTVGQESGISNVVDKVVSAIPPQPPTGLTVV